MRDLQRSKEIIDNQRAILDLWDQLDEAGLLTEERNSELYKEFIDLMDEFISMHEPR